MGRPKTSRKLLVLSPTPAKKSHRAAIVPAVQESHREAIDPAVQKSRRPPIDSAVQDTINLTITSKLENYFLDAPSVDVSSAQERPRMAGGKLLQINLVKQTNRAQPIH